MVSYFHILVGNVQKKRKASSSISKTYKRSKRNEKKNIENSGSIVALKGEK